MSRWLQVAVPPGVGDCYWALTKLKDYSRRNGFDKVGLVVQRTKLTRALEWAEMVDFVDQTREAPFRPDPVALKTGFSTGRVHATDVTFWPNAVIDRGEPLASWLPEYDLDLDFEISVVTPPPERAKRIVVYASSEGISRAWFPTLAPEFWSELLATLAKVAPVALIGARWDDSFRARLAIPEGVLDLVGATSLREVGGVLRDARAVVGIICGMTILANHWRTPTVALCPTHFPPAFPRAWVAENAPYTVMRPAEIRSARAVADVVMGLAR